MFLAPYFPFKLKGRVEWKHKNKIHSVELYGILPNYLQIENPYGGLDYCSYEDFKPILKPISDLSLLVIEEFEKYDGKRNGKANEEIINLFCEENGVDEIIENIVLSSLPYECIEFMFRNHYDFFGLISEGLAVSIHDVEEHCL